LRYVDASRIVVGVGDRPVDVQNALLCPQAWLGIAVHLRGPGLVEFVYGIDHCTSAGRGRNSHRSSKVRGIENQNICGRDGHLRPTSASHDIQRDQPQVNQPSLRSGDDDEIKPPRVQKDAESSAH